MTLEHLANLALTLLALTPAAALGAWIGNRLRRTHRDTPPEPIAAQARHTGSRR
jgi:hypothetical protein